VTSLAIVRWQRSPAVRERLVAALVWLLPVLAIWLVYYSPRHIVSAQTAIAGLLALGLLALAVRRPDRALLVLVAVLPFQGFLLAKLWSFGVPTSIVYHMGAWKEVLALGVIIAGARSFLAEGRRADALDRVALLFVAFIALYALLQPELVPSSPHATSARLLDFQELAGMPLVLLGARHAPLGPRFAQRACRVVFGAGTIVAAIGVYEAIFSSSWNHFVVHTIGYTRYEGAVLHNYPANPNDIRIYGMVGGAKIVRIGSVFVDELTLAWYLVLPFAIGFERMVRREGSRLTLLATVAIGAGLLLTQTRSALIAALIVVLIALQRTVGRPRHWRSRVAILLAGLAVVGVPAALASGLGARVADTDTAADNSSAGHVSGITKGLDTVVAHPLGRGLGTSAGAGQRLGLTKLVVPENNYLEIGDEVGVLPMLVFIALTIVLLFKLRAAAREFPDVLITAVWAAGAGLAVAALTLQTWLNFSPTWTYWGMAGAMLGVARLRAASAERQATSVQRPHVRTRQEPEIATSPAGA
jgi:O-Antigen ligase